MTNKLQLKVEARSVTVGDHIAVTAQEPRGQFKFNSGDNKKQET